MDSISIILIQTSRFLHLLSLMTLLSRCGKSRRVVERWLGPCCLFIVVNKGRALTVVIFACSHFESSAIIFINATWLRSPDSCLDWIGLCHLVAWLWQSLRRGLSSKFEFIGWNLVRISWLGLPISCKLGSLLKLWLSNVVHWFARVILWFFPLSRFVYF
jgi:hypothetical protein